MRSGSKPMSSAKSAAGQRGGVKVSQDRAHMAEIGKKGGQATAKSKSKK